MGLLMGNFHQFLTELSARHKIVAGYNCFMFLLIIEVLSKIVADITQNIFSF